MLATQTGPVETAKRIREPSRNEKRSASATRTISSREIGHSESAPLRITVQAKAAESTVKKAPPVYTIEGEDFEVVVNHDSVRLRHPKWSLTGRGRNLSEAELALFENAKILFPVYFRKAPHELSREAQRMREFMMQLV